MSVAIIYGLGPDARGLTISRRGPTLGQRHPPAAECGPTDSGRLRVYADKLVTDSRHPLEKLPLYLFRSSINRPAASTWLRSRMTRARPDGRRWEGERLYFFTRGGPRRPVGSAVCRLLTENASRHYEESPESGPTSRPEGTGNPCRMAAAAVASATARGVSATSAEARRRFSRSPRIDSVPVAPRVYGTTSAGITSEEVGPLCSGGDIHNAQVQPMHSRSVSRVKRAVCRFVR